MQETISQLSQYWAALFIGLLTVGGFGALLLWAILSGQFRNVEAPKHRILEIDQQTEVQDR